jgi:hypothetical protein
MKRLVLIAMLLTGACASGGGEEMVWQKDDMSNSARDVYECKKDARQTFGKLTLDNIDTAIKFGRECMASKGYVWGPVRSVPQASTTNQDDDRVFYKPTMTRLTLQKDSYDCEKETRQINFGRDENQANAWRFGVRCMEARGYSYVLKSSFTPEVLARLKVQWNK